MDRFRKDYTPLTDEQKALGRRIKEKAEELFALYVEAQADLETGWTSERIDARLKMTEAEREQDDAAHHRDCDVDRCTRIAMTRLEESVMWACKGVFTGGES